jgi:hypothetical protein
MSPASDALVDSATQNVLTITSNGVSTISAGELVIKASNPTLEHASSADESSSHHDDARLKKRLQNKEAALRYRQRKKQQMEERLSQLNKLKSKNRALRRKRRELLCTLMGAKQLCWRMVTTSCDDDDREEAVVDITDVDQKPQVQLADDGTGHALVDHDTVVQKGPNS